MQPLTPEQIVSQKRPSDPRLSPDGESIAFVLRPVAKKGEHGQSAIWTVPFRGGDARQFTAGQWVDDAPRWSPDGARLAFLSDRAERGKKSLYVMPTTGGEAIRVFDRCGEMSLPGWSPDGRCLAVLFTDPESDEDRRRKETRDDAKVWDADPKFQRLWVIDLATGDAKAVSPEGHQVWGYAWAADGERLAINSSRTPRLDEHFRETRVAIVSRAGGDTIAVCDQRGLAEDLVWSHDGAALAYRAPAGRVVHGECVYRVAVDGGERRCLTPDLPGSGEFLGAIADGRRLLFVATEGVHSVVYRLDWDGTRARMLAGEPWGACEPPVAVSGDGGRLAGIWSDSRNAPDIWVAETAGTAAEARLSRRTHLNPDLERVALGETAIVRCPSDPGIEIEGLVVTPHGYVAGRRYPLVVLVHGGPTGAWRNRFYAAPADWAQFLAGQGYAVLLPNPRGSTGRGSAFTDALFGDIGGCEFRDMMAGVDAMIERGLADPDRLGIGGWSWGGYMTAWAITQTNRFKAAVMGAGLSNPLSDSGLGDIPSANLSFYEVTPYHDPVPYDERSPIRRLPHVTTPTLILHGEGDKRVAMAQSIEMYVGLRMLGVESQLVTYPREEHAIEERHHQLDLLRRVAGWFGRHLRPEQGA